MLGISAKLEDFAERKLQEKRQLSSRVVVWQGTQSGWGSCQLRHCCRSDQADYWEHFVVCLLVAGRIGYGGVRMWPDQAGAGEGRWMSEVWKPPL